MIWMLFLIVLESDRYFVTQQGVFTSMEGCFKARDAVVQFAPQPKINYEAICIQTDKVQMQ